MVDHNNDIETLKAKLEKAERSAHTYRQLATKLQKKLEDMESAVEQKINAEVDQFRRSAKDAWRSAEEETSRLDDELNQTQEALKNEQEKRSAAERAVERLNNDLKDHERQSAQQIQAAKSSAGGADTKLLTKQIEQLRKENAQLHADLKHFTNEAKGSGFDVEDEKPKAEETHLPANEIPEEGFDIDLPGEITLHDPEVKTTPVTAPPKGPVIDTGKKPEENPEEKPSGNTIEKLNQLEQNNNDEAEDDAFSDAARQIYGGGQKSEGFVQYDSALPGADNSGPNKLVLGGIAAAVIVVIAVIGIFFIGGDEETPVAQQPAPAKQTPKPAAKPEPVVTKAPEPKPQPKPEPKPKPIETKPEPEPIQPVVAEVQPAQAEETEISPEASSEATGETTVISEETTATTENANVSDAETLENAKTLESSEEQAPTEETTAEQPAPAVAPAPVTTVDEEQQLLETKLREQAEKELQRLLKEKESAAQPVTNEQSKLTPEESAE